MNKIAALGVATLLTIAAPSMQGLAADTATTVKVALTDMSASAGMGPMGRWMLDQGPGWGQGMMGSGMMRPGYGWGPPGAQGPNLMMTMMAIRIDHDSVKAGPVTFDVTNWSRLIPHEMLIVAVGEQGPPLPYDYNQAIVKEAEVKVLGDTGGLQPNDSAVVEVTLAPGSYLLICNIPGHYAAGMATPLQVTP